MDRHKADFIAETGMEISYNSKYGRFELSGLTVKYAFETQDEAETHAGKLRRFDAECGNVLADFRHQMHDAYEPDPETHLRDRNHFYCARGLKNPDVFDAFVYKASGGWGTDAGKSAAMQSVADRFYEQHPAYRMGVYFTPNNSVSLFPIGWDSRSETLKYAERPTKEFLNNLTPEQMNAHKQLLRDFDLASDDFIYAAASGIDRGCQNSFAKAVEDLSGLESDTQVTL